MDILMSKKEILRGLNSLRIQPDGLSQRKYGVSVRYFFGKEHIPEKRIDYEIAVDLELEHHRGILTIHKDHIFYNRHEPDGMNEILGNAISKAFYPIRTHLNEKGLTTNEILNHEDIKQRWEKEKALILEKYSSGPLDDFFFAADEKISNRSGLEQSLQFDWFWNLFFHPKFINYGESRKTETALFLPVIPYQFPLRFQGIQTINKIPTDYHSFIIEFESQEEPAHPWFIPENAVHSNYFMTLKVIFDLDVYHHFPMHIRADFDVFSRDPTGNRNLIKKIKYTQFQQNTDGFRFMKLSPGSPFITGGLVVSEPNKWGFYKNKYENDW